MIILIWIMLLCVMYSNLFNRVCSIQFWSMSITDKCSIYLVTENNELKRIPEKHNHNWHSFCDLKSEIHNFASFIKVFSHNDKNMSTLNRDFDPKTVITCCIIMFKMSNIFRRNKPSFHNITIHFISNELTVIYYSFN